MAELNKQLRKTRIARGLTLLQVAEHLGVSEATVQRYESGGIKNIKYDVVTRLASLFSVEPSYLMGWSGETAVPAAGDPKAILQTMRENDGDPLPPQASLEKKILLEYLISKMEDGKTGIKDEIRYVNRYLQKKYGGPGTDQT